MPYEKEFNENRTEVKITATRDSRGFWDSEKKDFVKKEKIFEVVKKESVYKKIKHDTPIDLKGKYIEGFSLDEYRREYKGMEENAQVTLKNFDAEEAFFSGKKLPNIRRFGVEGPNFSDAVFEGDVNFKGANFSGGYVSFENVIFGDRRVDFQKANFGEEVVDFVDADFGDGRVDFAGANFGGEMLSSLTHVLEKVELSSWK